MRLSILLLFLSASMLKAQNAPIDFEIPGHGQQWTWTVFENVSNPPLEIIVNPDMTGQNTSTHVAQFTALQAGNPWAGCETMHGADIGSFTLDASNSTVTIKVWKNVISDVGIKLVRADSWSLGEIKVPNTLIGQWETLTFDMSSNEGQTYDQLVVFPDFDLNGRTQDNIIYFDEIRFSDGTVSSIEEEEEISVRIFPNPTSELLQIHAEEQIEQVELLTVVGEQLSLVFPMSNRAEMNVEDFPSGVYFIRVMTSSGESVKRFIKD